MEQVALRILKQCCVTGVPNSEFGTQLLIRRSCSDICLFRILSGTLLDVCIGYSIRSKSLNHTFMQIELKQREGPGTCVFLYEMLF